MAMFLLIVKNNWSFLSPEAHDVQLPARPRDPAAVRMATAGGAVHRRCPRSDPRCQSGVPGDLRRCLAGGAAALPDPGLLRRTGAALRGDGSPGSRWDGAGD